MTFALARPGLTGDWLGGPLRAFLTGLMLLAGLILLAACANLGSLFAARAADRSREVALRLALGSSRVAHSAATLYRSRADFTDRRRCSGLWGSVVLLRGLSVWQPLPTSPIHVPVNPDANVYGVALLLSFSERIPVWRGPGEAGASHRSLRGHQVGINRHSGAADYCPRPVAGRANCDLRGAGHFFDGRRARTAALAAQQFRL